MTTCSFPSCTTPPDRLNRTGQPVCERHQPVAVSGSWMGEGTHHHEPEGDDQ